MKNRSTRRAPFWVSAWIRCVLGVKDPACYLGDFQEVWSAVLQDEGWLKAIIWYLSQLWLLAVHVLCERMRGMLSMIKSYLKTAWRQMRREKVFSLIHLVGLAVGVAACLLIAVYVQFETSYDLFHRDASSIYRVNGVFQREEGIIKQAVTVPAMGPAMAAELPQVTAMTRFLDMSGVLRTDQGNVITVNPWLVDGDFFDIFSFGRSDEAVPDLSQPDQIVLTESAARRVFGSLSVIGRDVEIRITGKLRTYTVSGVVPDTPLNSSIRFDYLISMEALRAMGYERYLSSWGNNSLYTYVKLAPGVTQNVATDVTMALVKRHQPDIGCNFELQPLSHLHYESVNAQEGRSVPRIYLWALGLSAVLVLVLAGVNTMNLEAAQLSRRHRESGLRRVLGAGPRAIIMQMLVTTVLRCVLAGAAGVLLAHLAAPMLAGALTTSQLLSPLSSPWVVAAVLLAVMAFGTLAAVMPLLPLLKMDPARLFKGSTQFGRSNGLTWASLIFQFAVAALFIMAALTFDRQIRHLENRSLGFDQRHVAVIPLGDGGTELYNQLLPALRSTEGVLSVSGANAFPGGGLNGAVVRDEENRVQVAISRSTLDFPEFFHLKLGEGRYPAADRPTDESSGILINHALLDKLGWTSIQGKTLDLPWAGMGQVTVLGLLENFNYTSLKESIDPLVLYFKPEVDLEYCFIRLNPDLDQAALAAIEQHWRTVAPETPYRQFWLSDHWHALYLAERNWRMLLQMASLLMVVIACVGLFALSGLLFRRRMKEIGIRKVLGASGAQVIFTVGRSFWLSIAGATLLALPAAHWLMHAWLSTFAYRIALDWSLYGEALLLALSVAFAAVGWQALQASRHPVTQIIKNQ